MEKLISPPMTKALWLRTLENSPPWMANTRMTHAKRMAMTDWLK
jgi:hypothetical protein